MKFPGIRTEAVKFEFLNNKINIDKFPERFMDRTNVIFSIYSTGYMDNMK